MYRKLKVGDTVNIDKEAVVNNKGNLRLGRDDEYFIYEEVDIGEEAYRLKEKKSGKTVYIREG